MEATHQIIRGVSIKTLRVLWCAMRGLVPCLLNDLSGLNYVRISECSGYSIMAIAMLLSTFIPLVSWLYESRNRCLTMAKSNPNNGQRFGLNFRIF